MQEHDCVKIVKLLHEDRYFDGTEGIKRPPQVGDVGVIVHMIENFCIVEMVTSDGNSIWIADFLTEELELYERDNFRI